MLGVWNKTLLVDLSDGTCSEIPLEEITERHLGGRGIASYILLKLTKPGFDPLGAESPIIISTGPLNVPGYPGGARCMVSFKSPLTGSLYESMGGGKLAWDVRGTGFDALVIKGALKEWGILVVDEGKVRIEPAEGLKGFGTGETEIRLKASLGKGFSVLAIGPAGERLIPFSSAVHNHHRVFGRAGLGAVMGSKKLKAICVRGRKLPKLYNRKRFKEISAKVKKILEESPYGNRLMELGTGSGMENMNSMGLIPTRYYMATSFEGIEKISPSYMKRVGIMTGKKSCPSCPLRCIKVVEIPDMGVEAMWGGPEYETLVSFGSMIMNDDVKGIARLHKRCNDLGIDTITTGSIVAMVFEAVEKRIIRENDLGLRVSWGDVNAAEKLLDLMVEGKGIGSILSKGSRKAAEILGIDDPVHVKGLEIPYQEVRGNTGMAISYATSYRGAVHTEGFRDTFHMEENSSPDLGIVRAMDNTDIKGKAPEVVKGENFRSFLNSLILCFFTVMITGPKRNVGLTLEAVRSVTGMELSMEDAMEIGERNYIMGRLFMLREGIMPSEDRLPERFFRPSIDGRFIEKKDFQNELKRYYRERGFTEDGIPTEDLLKHLDLQEFTSIIKPTSRLQ